MADVPVCLPVHLCSLLCSTGLADKLPETDCFDEGKRYGSQNYVCLQGWCSMHFKLADCAGAGSVVLEG
ncbi:unnamed protein product [Linum trigynum]|uniref:GCM domain-containing protein n=1 Tax=Linum trigynum TaxID=586398 RepID=A0AAV2DU30_9ROSI